MQVAAGGRYDGLLRSLWPPASAAGWPAPCGVGATLNVEKIASLAAELLVGTSLPSVAGVTTGAVCLSIDQHLLAQPRHC
jgi:histidyl-tRNA synthetase